MIVSILIFLIIFSVIVISHEFGHFAVARRGGIRVLEFDIGMGPVLFRKEGKETDLCIRLLPIGGACIFDGMEEMVPEEGEAPRELDEHSFPNTPVGSRIAAVLAMFCTASAVLLSFAIVLIFTRFLLAFLSRPLAETTA